ncbi:MAG TPA: hypothetical protein VGL09_22375 [Methylomirabilota bacterium]
MDDATLRDRVRVLLARHRHRASDGEKLWAGPGSDSPCSACGLVITASETEFELNFGPDAVERLHRRCYAVWDSERHRR